MDGTRKSIKKAKCAVMNGQTCIDEDTLRFYKDNNHMYQAAVLLDTFNRTVKFRDIYIKKKGGKEKEACAEWLPNETAEEEGGHSKSNSMLNANVPQTTADMDDDQSADPCENEDFSDDSLESNGSECEEDSLEVPYQQYPQAHSSPREMRNPAYPMTVSFQPPYENYATSQRPPGGYPRSHVSPQQGQRGKIVRTTKRIMSPNSTWLSPSPDDMMNAVSSTPLTSPKKSPQEVTCYYETRHGRKPNDNTTVGICVSRSKSPRAKRTPK